MQETAIPDTRPPTRPDAHPSAPSPTSETLPADEVPAVTDATAAPAPTRARHDNPLVAGLIRAMRDAARTARQETAARFSEEAKARVEAIHAQSADQAAELRKQADTAIVEIRDWSKAEMARIREETDQRIADRRRQLESDVSAHAEQVEHRIERVQVASGDFEHRMDAFFERLLSEEDPARLAGLAERLPEPPALDGDLPDPLLSLRAEALDASGAAAAEAEAFAGLDQSDLHDAETGASPSVDSDDDMPAEADVVRRLEAFTGPSVTADVVATRLAVVGLVSVASIAGFKRAVATIHGVRSVTVASGPTGDFIFTVSHTASTDLRSAIPALDGFEAVITGDNDGVVTVTAADPDHAQ
jgi:gas vesicle protein